MVLEQFIIDADIIWDQVGKTFFENPEAKPGRIMRVQVVNAGIVEDLTGYTLNLGWTSVRDPSKFGLDAFDDVDITKGIFEIEYTSGMLTNIGPLNASLQLVPPGEGRPVESNNFKLTVKNSAINPEAIQGETSFSTLENALVEVNGWNVRIDAVEQEFKDRADALDGAYPDRLVAVEQQASQAAIKADAMASGSPKGVYATLELLQAAYPTGTTGAYLVTGNVAEVASLMVSTVPITAGNLTVTLNGVSKTIAVDPAVQTTVALLATLIRGRAFTGWTTGGSGAVVTFTATTTGSKTDGTFSAGTTGATGTMSTTTQGVDADGKWYYWSGSAWVSGGVYQASALNDDQLFGVLGLPNPQPNRLMKNGVTNGDFSAGTSGWGGSAATITAANNVLKIIGNGTGIYPQTSQPLTINYKSGDKLYIRAKCKVTSSECTSIKYFIASGGMGTLFADAKVSPAANTVYNVSKIITQTPGGNELSSVSIYLAHYYATKEIAAAKEMEVQDFIVINISEVFGRGTEPNEALVDALLEAYSPGRPWFNGTQTIPLVGFSNGKTLAEVNGVVKFASPSEYITAIQVPIADTRGYFEADNVEAAIQKTYEKVNEVYNPINESFTYSQGIKNVKDLVPAVGGQSWQYTTSTFSGWGAPIGKAQNFNTLVFKIRNRAANTLPVTQIRAGISVFSSAGASVVDKLIDTFNILPGEEKLVYFDFGQNIPNTAMDELWAYFKCNQLIDVTVVTTASNLNAPNYGNVCYQTGGVVTAGTAGMAAMHDPDLTHYDKALLYVADSSYLYLPKQAFVDALGVPAAVPSKVTVNLPDKYDLVVGDTFELFFKGILMSNDPDQYNIVINCSKGQQFKKRYTYTPLVGDIGTHSMTISVYDDEEKLLGTKVTNLVVKAKATNPSTMKNILNIGDSLTSGGLWPQELHHRLVEVDGLTNLKFIGSKVVDGNVGYEGYGGWTYDSYTTNYADNSKVWVNVGSHDKDASDQWSIYQDANGAQWKIETIEPTTIKMIRTSGTTAMPASGTLTWVSGGVHTTSIAFTSTSPESGNPFWNEDTSAVDFANYATELGITSIDYVNILLGWNSTGTGEEAYKGKVRNFINLIRASFPDAKITLLGLQVPSLDGFGANYGVSWNFYEKLKFVFNLDRWHKAVCAEFTGVDYVNVSAQFDTENNMPSGTRSVNVRNSKTETYGTNGVHPDAAGYYQIADAIYRNMNNKLS